MSDQNNNLEFFKAAILEPALASPSEQGNSQDFGYVEAANSACLGAQIGYFDANEAYELIATYQTAIFLAWHRLTQRNIAPIIGEPSFSAISSDANGVLSLNREVFAQMPCEGPQDLPLSTFQQFLLLTSETVHDRHTQYFLDAITWTHDEEWYDHKRGTAPRSSVESLASGFSNVLRYWEEMNSLFQHQVLHFNSSEYQDAISLYQDAISLGSLRLRNDPDKPFSQYKIWMYLSSSMNWIVRPRFNLTMLETQNRYFELAGEFTSLANDGTPEWFDAQRRVFFTLRWLMNRSGSGLGDPGEEYQWSVFSRGVKPRRDIGSGAMGTSL